MTIRNFGKMNDIKQYSIFNLQSISNFHYVEFIFGPFSILINFPYKSFRYLELGYHKLSLCRTIFSVLSFIFELFPIRYLEHLNEVFESIILIISGIRMLITLFGSLFFLFFNTVQATTCPQLRGNAM